MKDKWLIGIDLDGTTLQDEKINHNSENKREDSIHKKTIDGIKYLIEMGHEVVIATGRNWEESKNIYKSLGMKSFIINSAGAHIHNPSDSSFEEKIVGMNNKIIKEILNDQNVMKNATGYTVDELNKTYLKSFKEKDDFYKAAHKFWDTSDFDGDFNFNPQSSVIYFNCSRKETEKILYYCRKKWGEEIHFTYWGSLKSEKESNGIEFNPAKSNKGTALMYVAEQLEIPKENTMGIGDGENDIELIKMSSYGVKMLNGSQHLNKYAKEITKLTNDEGGVGDFLIKHFKEKDSE